MVARSGRAPDVGTFALGAARATSVSMTALFHAHSGLRFLILLVGALNVLVLGAAQLQKRPYAKVHRVLGASFAGLLHVQVVLGIAMVAMGRYYPALIGHIVLMILAAVAAQVSMSVNRRRPEPTVRLQLIGVVIALVCIVGGVMSIGRGLFTVTAL